MDSSNEMFLEEMDTVNEMEGFLSDSDNEDDEESEEEDSDEDPINFISIPSLSSYGTASTFTSEEKEIIDSCLDQSLKSLLILNRSKHLKLIQTFHKIRDLIVNCQRSIKMKTELTNAEVNKSYCLLNHKLGAPYFKTKDGFTAPSNSDVEKKRASKELSVYDVRQSTKWSRYECDNLVGAVRVDYNVNQEKEILYKMNALTLRQNKEKLSRSGKASIVKELETLTVELEKARLKKDMPPLNSDYMINWSKVSDFYLGGKHTMEECKAFWHLYLHPSINKSQWTEAENIKIVELVKAFKMQDWKNIALALNTGRSGFTVCLHYFSTIYEKYRKLKFTMEEDNALFQIVSNVRTGHYIPWGLVEQYFGDRSRTQLKNRYRYFLSNANVVRKNFTEAEDILIMILVNRFGKKFSHFGQYLPHRSQIQIKNRYITNLVRECKKGTFTVEEDQLIMGHHDSDNFDSWGQIVPQLQRTRGQIRQRYLAIKNFLDCNPDKGIEDAPRRRHMSLDKERNKYDFILYMAKKFEDTDIPSLKHIEKLLGVKKTIQSHPMSAIRSRLSEYQYPMLPKATSTCSITTIDSILIDLCNKHDVEETEKEAELKLCSHVKEIQKMLSRLGVQLELPDEIKEDSYIDKSDVKILNILKATSVDDNDLKVVEQFGPNLNNLIGFRNLLVKNRLHKMKYSSMWYKDLKIERNKSDSKILFNMLEVSKHLNESEKWWLKYDKDLFFRRFVSLFGWPFFCTLVEPNQGVLSIKPADKIIYKRKNNSSESSVPNKKIATSSNNSKETVLLPGLNLQPVPKSVVKKLLSKQKNPNMYVVKNASAGSILSPVKDIQTFLDKPSTSQVDMPNLNIDDIKTGISQKMKTYSSKLNSDSNIQNKKGPNAKLKTKNTKKRQKIKEVDEEEQDILDVQKLDALLKQEHASGKSDLTESTFSTDPELFDELINYDTAQLI